MCRVSSKSGKSVAGFLRHWESSLDFKPVMRDQSLTAFLKPFANSTNTLKFLTLLLIILHIQSAVAVKIKRMNVPRSVENGTVDSVILDCEYSYTDEDRNLVVKWFLDGDPEPVYQWITEYNTRYASKRFESHINMNYMAAPSENLARYRALNIIKPTTIFNGKYSCHVVSLKSQDTAEKYMTVYAPPKGFNLNLSKSTNSGANLSCEANAIFPMPHLMLYRTTIYDKEPQMVYDLRSQYDTTANGAFDTIVFHEIVDRSLPPGEPVNYECVVSIDRTRLTMKKNIIYYPGISSFSASRYENIQILWFIIIAFGLCFS